MKILPLILMLSLGVVSAFSQPASFMVAKTNGQSTFMTIQKGLKPAPVPLVTGVTYDVNKVASYQFQTTTDSFILALPNELSIKIYTNSDFTINSYVQDILNVNKTPEKAKLGSHNFAGTLLNGTAVISYSGGDSNTSSCIISTPMTDLELYKGTFYFKVSEGKVLVFVLDGSLKSHGDKSRENIVTAGYAVIAVPNDIGILEAKISLGAEKVKKAIIDKLTSESSDIINLKGTIMFATIDGKTVGIVIN